MTKGQNEIYTVMKKAAQLTERRKKWLAQN